MARLPPQREDNPHPHFPRILRDILREMSREPGSVLAAYRGMLEDEDEPRREKRKGGDG